MVDIVVMPVDPPPIGASFSPVSFATDLSGPLGGPTQRVLRIGDRFKVEYSFAPMTYDQARPFLARLLRGAASPIAMLFPQRGLRPVAPGVVVNGGAASGGLLPVRSGTPNFLLLEGQFFSLSSGGRRWIHQIQEDTQLDGTGAATLPINPLLRVQPADGDTMEFVAPLIEGFANTDWKWTIEWVARVGLTFTVTEDR